MMNLYRFIILFCLLPQLAFAANTNTVNVSQNWVRASAPGQSVGAAYMTLQSTADTSLIKVESDAAGTVEIHNMSMKNGVMQMRMMDTLPLSAGKSAKLEPGGYHLMLFDLKKPLAAGEKVHFTLHFKDSAGKTSVIQVSSPVKTSAE